MFNQDFLEFLERLDEKLRAASNKRAAERNEGDNRRAYLYGRVAKLTEEVGELAGAVLLSQGSGRKSKREKFDPHNLEQEFGDVIITACLLARNAGVDLNTALKSRHQEIEERLKLSDY